MVLRIKLTVFRTADFALCLVLAGRFPAGVLSQLLAAIITLVVFVIVCTLADYIIADITFMVFVCIDAILRLRACRASVNGADAGVRAVPVGCPRAIVMAERFAIGKGFRALRAAGGAGVIIYRRACAGGGGLQPVFVHLIDKMVRAKLAVRVLADLAEGRGKAVGRAALMRAVIDLQMAAGVESPVAVAVKLPVTRLFGVPIRVRFPGGKGRLVGCPLGGQHTDLAGLVIECGREAVCFLVQKCRDRNFSREVVLGHFDAAGVAEVVAVWVGVFEPLSLSAADGAGLPVTDSCSSRRRPCVRS